jgi:hypothetical protein
LSAGQEDKQRLSSTYCVAMLHLEPFSLLYG